jgi:hypothetical protein
MGCPALAATTAIELHPLPRTGLPVPTRVVNPKGVPAQYRDAVIRLFFTVDTAGMPRNIKVLELDDPALTDSLVTALAQWRFTPASRQGVAVSMDVVLPLELSGVAQLARADRQVGAFPVATQRNGRTPVRPDLNTHEALLHVNVVTRDGQVFVMDGMSEGQVREALGQPQIIAENVWAYPQYEAASTDADRHGCDTVLISFQNHRVATMALANDRAIKFAAIQLQSENGYIERVLQGMHQATNVAQN